MNKYYIEMTDTFGGEANYCWVNRFTCEAKSMKAALTKVKQDVYNFPAKVRHTTSDYGDMLRADVKKDCVVFFVYEADEFNMQESNIMEL